MKQRGWAILVVLLLLVCAYLLMSFYGLPWKKAQTAKELEAYVEDKYDIAVHLKERHYNFKGMNYGATFVLEDNEHILFTAEKYKSGTLSDYYAEALWVEEAKNDIDPLLKESFASLTMKESRINPVYGMGDELVKDKEVPSYKMVKTGVDVAVYFKDEWNKTSEVALVNEGFKFIQLLKEKGIVTLGVRLYLERELEENRTQMFAIAIEPKDFQHITSPRDMEKYTMIF